MATLKQFNQKINKIAREIQVNANDVKRKVALAVDQIVVLATPVLTGRARANWRVGLGEPVRGATKDVDKSGQTTIQDANLKINESKSEEDIFISNNVPYIEPLNNGSSAQAPAGFVEKAVQKGVDVVRNSRIT